MTHSEQIKDLAAALATAQGELEGAKKDSLNPHFKNKYADLASVWDACREALTANGLSVVQSAENNGEGGYGVTTMLLHTSGQWMSGTLYLKPTKDDPQGAGSALTYARRYALASMVGIAPEDDDGNAASQKPEQKAAAPKQPKPANFDNWLLDLEAVAQEGTTALEAAWRKSSPEYRAYFTLFDNPKWEAIKAKAAKVPQMVGA